ncbi:hypothetical protein [Sorangium sp. So ce590]
MTPPLGGLLLYGQPAERQVVVRLERTDTYELDANREHTALRCP